MARRVRQERLRRPVGPVTVVITVGPGQERWLEECRASILGQGYRDVAIEEVSWTSDLATARNEGVARAGGKYLLLLEASDSLLPGAIGSLAHRLARAGAGMAAGRSRHTHEGWRDRSFRPAPGVNLHLGNRLIDRQAWVEAGLAFDTAHGGWPVATLARAHLVLGTEGVDDLVHDDRARSAALPFGHLRPWAREAGAWATAHAAATNTLATDPVGPAWAASVVDRLRLLDDCAGFSESDWTAVEAAAAGLVALADPDLVRVEARVGAHLAAAGRREDLVDWIEARWRAEPDLPTSVEGAEVYADPGPAMPREVLRLSARETPLFASLRRWSADEEGLHLDLVALIRGVDALEPPEVRVSLHDGSREVPLRVSVTDGAEAAKVAGDAWHDHRHAQVHATLPSATMPARGRWQVRVSLRVAGVSRAGVVRDRDLRAGPGQPLRMAGRRATWVDGAIEFGRAPSRGASSPTVTEVRLIQGGLEVTGVGDPGGTLRLSGRSISVEARVDDLPEGFVAKLPLTCAGRWGDALLPVGDYRLSFGDDSPLGLADGLLGRTPTDSADATYRMRVRVDHDAAPLVELSPPRGDDQVGPSAQRRLRQWYAEERPLDPGLAYFQSFTGEHVTDNPLAIQQALARLRPDIRVQWGVADATVPVPAGTTRVLMRSPEWYSALATSAWVVTNIELERWFRRRPGQQVLQTWHGNPGKSMGRALWEASGYREHRIEAELARRRATWTAMLSPTEEMAEHYRAQFEYDGPVLGLGHPRDDVLVGPRAGEIRDRTRAALGVSADQTAVLYGPTWRDELATNFRRGAMPDHLDLAAASRALGEEHVILVRGHRFHRDVQAAGARVVDVTDHPAVNDLILAADVGLFDYSSLRFDFGLTGKPMLFLVPDLERYRELRTFLFPFEESAPGPLLGSTAEVVAALQALPAIEERYADARAAFVARFHAEQDAHSSERVVRAFFGDAPRA